MKSDYIESAKTAAWIIENHPDLIAFKTTYKTYCGSGSPKARLNPETGNMVIYVSDLREWLDRRFPWWQEEGIERDKKFFKAKGDQGDE